MCENATVLQKVEGFSPRNGVFTILKLVVWLIGIKYEKRRGNKLFMVKDMAKLIH